MAKSRLHQLSELGQSVWIDSLSRDVAQDGELARMMEEDAVVGVTSNPTIFQKAMAEGEAYDDQLRELHPQSDGRHEGDLLPARGAATSRTRATCSAGLGRRRRAATGTSRSRSIPNLALRHRGDHRARRCASTSWVDRPNLYVKIPATQPGLACDRGDDRARPQHQRHADLLPRAPHGGGRVLHPRARAARRSRRRPVDGRVGRQLLRLPRGHRGGPAPRRGRAGAGAEGQARDREREARLPRTTKRPSRASAGRLSPRRARARSDACGPRRRPRTPSTETSCTSRS